MDVHTVSAYKTIQDWRFIPLDALEKLFSATKIIGNFNMAKKLTLHWRLLRHDLLKPDQYHEEAVLAVPVSSAQCHWEADWAVLLG